MLLGTKPASEVTWKGSARHFALSYCFRFLCGVFTFDLAIIPGDDRLRHGLIRYQETSVTSTATCQRNIDETMRNQMPAHCYILAIDKRIAMRKSDLCSCITSLFQRCAGEDKPL